MIGHNVPHAYFQPGRYGSPTKEQMSRALSWIKRYATGGYVRFDLAMDEVFDGSGYTREEDHLWFFKEIKKRGLKCWFVVNESIPNKDKWREIEGIEWKPDTPLLYPWWNIPNVYWPYLNQNVQQVLDLARSVFGTLDGHLVEDGNERHNTYDNKVDPATGKVIINQIPGLPYGEMPNNFIERQLNRWVNSDHMNLYGAKWIGSSMESGSQAELNSSKPLWTAAQCVNYHSYGAIKFLPSSLPAYVGEISKIGVPQYKRSRELRNMVNEAVQHYEAVCGYAAMSLTNPEYSVLS